jgi:hypothetical protein
MASSSNIFDNESASSKVLITSEKSISSYKFATDLENKPDYSLQVDIDSSIFIFKKGLFSRTLSSIDLFKPRKMECFCTL